MSKAYIIPVLLVLFLMSCGNEKKEQTPVNFYETDLFKAVQLEEVFEDSKTFVDLVPKESYATLNALYLEQKETSDFSLTDFVTQHFSDKSLATLSFATDTTKNMYEHIHSIWPKLKRGPDAVLPYSSRIALPKSYIVPGGRFQEIYYWDSYFTLEGLLVDGQKELARNMVDNFAHLIDSIGFIPNGTRDYYLTRSQPPFYTLMVDALAQEDQEMLLHYFPTIRKEYEFWMEDEAEVTASFQAQKRVLRTANGAFVNRYWDSGKTPRPESYKEDYLLAQDLGSPEEKERLYINLRSGAASGWDFSSRWYAKEGDFASTGTADIAAIDLNCLLYFMESKIAEGYGLQGDDENAALFMNKAEKRKEAIQLLFWNEELAFFMDFDFKARQTTDELTLAGVFPLFFELATPEQAEAIKTRVMDDFLKDGGLVTTLKHSGQQWDAPNGWAPLQWIAVKGLLHYGYVSEAEIIMERWLALNERVYRNTGKMMEKYNVEDVSLLSGGGEYETQDGFGWTNGVALGFKALLSELEAEK